MSNLKTRCRKCIKNIDENILRMDVWEEWINKHSILTHVGVFLIFVFFACISNWSLLLGENLMKWDIWQAEYPMQVLMSDAIANHTVPIWNPLMQYGTPYYSIVGSPIWYPFTMLLACIGYTPVTLAMSYVLHVAIGAFGMFLLAGEEIRNKYEKWTIMTLITCIVAGLLFGTSGIFLSNAQHIMIIISAAWIPYVFYYTRRYLRERKIFWAMTAGLCAGLIFLGGYPELFYDLFLFLVPYVLFFSYSKEKGVASNVICSISKFIIIGVFAALACAISLIPFLKNMGLITRGNGLGQIPNNYTFATFLSFLFPQTSQFLPGVEVSMVNYYMGIIVVLLVPHMIRRKAINKKLYLGLIMFAFWLCGGGESFLHTLIYRFFPMYSSFRFPTLNRVFLTIFFLLLFVGSFKEILEGIIDDKEIWCSKILLCVVGILSIVCVLIGNLLLETSNIFANRCLILADSAFTATCFIASYLLIFRLIQKRKGNSQKYNAFLIMLICAELLTFGFLEGPITVTKYGHTDYSYNQAVQNDVDFEFEKNENRNRNINFAGQKRSTSGLDSQSIVFNKTFDEEGYLSFKLQSIDEFKMTYNRSIIEQNPVIYFTNDVVSAEKTPYEQWINACNTPSEQIYVEQALKSDEATVQKLSPVIVSEENLEIAFQTNLAIVKGNLSATADKTGRIRMFFDKSSKDSVDLQLIFEEADGTQQVYSGEFQLHESDEGMYIDIYFPNVDKEYKSVQINSYTNLPKEAKLVVTERMTEDSYVDVSWFGFNDIEMKVEAPTEGYVTILQAMHDGWVAYVDGEETEISIVNQCFMGIHVMPGEHDIVMKFRPKEFFVGMSITVIYIITMIVVWLKTIYFNYKKTN